MKAGKPNNLFSTKLSAILSKFKESTTVHVAHEQARALFNEFALRDVLTPFLSKMDNCDHLSDRQRKEYSKTYLTLVDAYKEEILSEAHYERILESLNRKTAGVSEVVGHICKTLLNRMQDLQQLYPYVSVVLNIFHAHPEIPKIFRQVIETIDCNIIASLQSDIISVLIDRIPNAKVKSDYLEAVQALVLCLQEKLTAQPQVVGLLLKYLRNEDWNCRKTSVEIAYALLVINQQINETVHATIRELKYDKIKHVRDSVNNYEALYKQVYAEELAPKPQPPSIRQTKIKSDHKKTNTRSPVPLTAQKETRETREIKEIREPRRSEDKSNSLEKSAKLKQKNENFFKNAKNSDVIRTNEDNRNSLELQRQDHRQFKDQNSEEVEIQLPIVKMEETGYYDEKNNFEAYLKKRTSPQSPPFSKSPIPKTPPIRHKQEKKIQKYESIKSSGSKGLAGKEQKFNYQNELQNFKKKNKISEIEHIHYQQSPKQSASFAERSFDKSQQEFSISCIENKNEQTHFEEFKNILLEFQKRINGRLDKLEKRIDMLENNRTLPNLESLRISNSSDRQPQSVEVRDKMEKADKWMQAGRVQPDSPESYLYNQSPNDSKWQYSESQGVESNLEEKVKASIVNQNWDQAFTLALTNNRKNILLNLLQRCVFPQDRTVEQCIMLQLRKLLDYSSALKWLKYYLMQRDVPRTRLLKLREELVRRGVSSNKNYEMMRQLVLQEIADKLDDN